MSQKRDTYQQRPETQKGYWSNSQVLSVVLGAAALTIAPLGIALAVQIALFNSLQTSINDRLDRQETRYIAVLDEAKVGFAVSLEEVRVELRGEITELRGEITELRGLIESWGKRIEVIEKNVGVLSSDIAALKAQIDELGGAATASWMPAAGASISFHKDADALKPPVLIIWMDDIPDLSPESRHWLANPLFSAPAVSPGGMGADALGHMAWASSLEDI